VVIATIVIMVGIQCLPLAQGEYVGEQVQILEGTITPGSIDSYNITNLTTENTLYVYLNGTSGDLDPFVALTTSNASLVNIVETFERNIQDAIDRGQDYNSAITETANELFIAWDDDSGWGYAAAFSWNVSEDGDYKLLVVGVPIRKTFGQYSLEVGLNSPDVMEGKGTPTGDVLAVLNPEESEGIRGVQEVFGNLTSERSSIGVAIMGVDKGEHLYLFIESTSGNETPMAILYDYGGKVLRTTNESVGGNNATLSYEFKDGVVYKLEIRGGDPSIQYDLPFRLLVGLNEPKVLTGNATPMGRQVLQTSMRVETGLELVQITSVDQRAENYAIVANLWMKWNDPMLAFSPDTCECPQKVFRSIDEFVEEYGDLWPEFFITNQQERRWTQNLYFVVQPNGTAVYFERFWVTLQAPDFDFRDFPFDTQEFNVRVQCIYRDEIYHFVTWDERTAVGDQLGEEEWRVVSYDTEIDTVEVADLNSRFSFEFTADRNLSYYAIRIFFPLVIIFGLTWITWSISNYDRRITVATGNLLLFIAFSFTIGDDLPRLGYLTIMDKILISLFVWTALVVAYNFYMSRLTEKRREELSKRIDRYLVWGFPFAFFITYLVISWVFP
jgi:hypothetical protein